MNNNYKVTTICYGLKREWKDCEEAKSFFLNAMMNSEGAEHDRYSSIYIQLQNGQEYCTDKTNLI